MATIGDKIVSLEFSQQEKVRIATALLDPGSLQSGLLRRVAPHIHDNGLWRSAQKFYRVQGFREGSTQARAVVLKRLAEELTHQNRDPTAAVHWPMYRACVTHYVVHEAPQLNRLLLLEQFQQGEGGITAQIFRCISAHLAVYEAPVESAEMLYELWGFERDGAVRELLQHAPVSASLVRRIAQQTVEELKEQARRDVRALREDLNSAQHELALLAERQRSDSALIEDKLSKLSSRKQEGACVDDLPSQERRLARRPRSDAPQRRIEDVQKKEAERIGNIEDKTAELQKRISRLEQRVSQSSNTADPLARRNGDGRIPVAAFHSKLRAEFLRCGLPPLSDSGVMLLGAMIRGGRVFVTDRARFLTAPFSILANAEVQTIAASPLWTSVDEWGTQLKFVCESVDRPRILVIEDFDIGFQEAYLVPGLSIWQSQVDALNQNRILLVPSESELTQIDSRIADMSVFITSTAVDASSRAGRQESDGIGGSGGASQLLELSWLTYHQVSASEEEKELRQYARNIGVELPERVLRSFTSLLGSVGAEFPRNYSGRIAVMSTLVPWARVVRGATVARIVEDAMLRLFDGQ